MARVDRLKIGNNEYELRGTQINNLQITISNLQNTVNNLSNRVDFLKDNLIGSIHLSVFEKYNNYCNITVQTTNVSNKNNIRYYTKYDTFGTLDITSFVTYVSSDNDDFTIRVSTNVLSSFNLGWDTDSTLLERRNIRAEVVDDFGNSISSNTLFIDSYTGNSSNGHYYVDLGLPSGTKWATMNIGAYSITEYGNYYMYGKGSRTFNIADTPYTGTENPLARSVDTAAQVWGGQWHMPTQTQLQELIDNTTLTWKTNYNGSGINGGLYTASNGKSVFFPAGGAIWYFINDNYVVKNGVGTWCYYWSSSPYNNSGENKACVLYCRDCYSELFGHNYYYGATVRGVIG